MTDAEAEEDEKDPWGSPIRITYLTREHIEVAARYAEMAARLIPVRIPDMTFDDFLTGMIRSYMSHADWRWGQLVFRTEIDKDGWDGRINGRLQNSGVFVWMCSAVDYQGNTIFLKGTCALIR